MLGGLHSATPVELKQRLAMERAGTPFVVYRDGEGKQRFVPLSEARARVTIGRRPANDIVLDFDAEISRVHAQLERVAGDWTLSDDGLSRNGTFVNQQLVTRRVKLGDGDLILIGRTPLLFRAPSGRAGSEPTEVRAEVTLLRDVTGTRRRVLIALCRPVAGSPSAPPATNKEIADELVLSIQAVKAHVRELSRLFEVSDLPQYRKRVELAKRAVHSGLLLDAELAAPTPG